MPLSSGDRRFLQTVERLKLYLVFMALTVFLYLLLAPSSEIQMTTSVIGIALCGIFWLTQRLLSFITLLDLELTRVVTVLKRSLPKEQQKEFFGSQ
jgi:hypothetical protein